MKYVVERASTFFDETISPCKEAHLELILHTDERTADDPSKIPSYKNNPNEWFEEKGYFNHRVENGHIKRDYWKNEWVIEINTLDELMRFTNDYGDIVIYRFAFGTTLPQIMIYDDYIE